MAGSGIKITDEVKTIFQQINMRYRKKSPEEKAPLRYALFKFNEKNDAIVVSEAVEPTDAMDYTDLINTLPTNDVRYLAYDYEYMSKQNQPNRKVILISWIPEGSTIKRKMLAASTFNILKSAVGVSKDYIEAGELADVLDSEVADKLGGTVKPKQ